MDCAPCRLLATSQVQKNNRDPIKGMQAEGVTDLPFSGVNVVHHTRKQYSANRSTPSPGRLREARSTRLQRQQRRKDDEGDAGVALRRRAVKG